jgi:hypothetical protein
MDPRTPSWNFYLEIPESIMFTEDEKQVMKKAITGLQRFVIDDAWITRFRLWADTQAQINEARAKLGKVVVQIITERKNKQDGSGTTGNN